MDRTVHFASGESVSVPQLSPTLARAVRAMTGLQRRVDKRRTESVYDQSVLTSLTCCYSHFRQPLHLAPSSSFLSPAVHGCTPRGGWTCSTNTSKGYEAREFTRRPFCGAYLYETKRLAALAKTSPSWHLWNVSGLQPEALGTTRGVSTSLHNPDHLSRCAFHGR